VHSINKETDLAAAASLEHDDVEYGPPTKRRRFESSVISKGKVTCIKELLVGLVANNNLPFTLFEDPYMKSLFQLFNPDLADKVPVSRTTLRSEVAKIYAEKRMTIQEALRQSLTQIHLSFDLWTSPNGKAFVAVIAHFIDKERAHQTRLLALRRISGPHNGSNIATILLEVVGDWGIVEQVGVAVSDNVTSNHTCLVSFYRQLDPTMALKDIDARRMRCYGHILNLVAQAMLHGTNEDAFDLDDEANRRLDDCEATLRDWRANGPIGKLHKVVKFIRSSPQRSERFKDAAMEGETETYLLSSPSTAELSMIQNNATRWNSTYLMIQRAHVKRRELVDYLDAADNNPDDRSSIPAGSILDGGDWRQLTELMSILEPFHEQTMRTQGQGVSDGHGRLWEVIIGIEFLLTYLEAWMDHYNGSTANEGSGDDLEDDSPPASPTPSQSAMPPPLTPAGRRSARVRQPTARAVGDGANAAPRAPRRRQRRRACRREAQREILKDRVQRLSVRDTLTEQQQGIILALLRNAWFKLNKYYKRLEESPLFAAAVILHPGYGINWLSKHWVTPEGAGWIITAREELEEYHRRWYAPEPNPPRPATPEPQRRQAPPSDPAQEPPLFKRWLNHSKTNLASTATSELERYYLLGQQETTDVIGWWLGRQQQFPTLYRLALDIWAIPAMAAACERTFSLAKLTLTSQRHAMTTETLEELQCIKNWSEDGAIVLGCTPRPRRQ
jgi:hypothetical protein